MKLALGIEYDGARYSGWQRQDNVPSVQQKLEEALSYVADAEITVTCAGRTDAGVHATTQIVHFEPPKERKLIAWILGTNSKLPHDIAVKWVHPVSDEFHARYSATARRYRYVIYNSNFRPAIMQQGITHVHDALDAEAMHRAAQALVGEHDFSSFRATHCQANTPFRHLTHITVERTGDFIVVDVAANAFLHHMVRNIVGSLISIGKGEQPETWMADLLKTKDRKQAGVTAKPNGLYLVRVFYPEHFGLPQMPMGPLFLPEN